MGKIKKGELFIWLENASLEVRFRVSITRYIATYLYTDFAATLTHRVCTLFKLNYHFTNKQANIFYLFIYLFIFCREDNT